MNNIKLIEKVKSIWEAGDNIMNYLKKLDGRTQNNIEDILISYDFQSGSYIENAKRNPELTSLYSKYLADIIDSFSNVETIMEAGVGEATTMTHLLLDVKNNFHYKFGFDISWSRIKYAREYSQSKGVDIRLFVADLFSIPLPDNSVDIVYTSHTIEPNGGREVDALRELYRVASKYLILLEPTDEFANEEGKKRMKNFGYVSSLKEKISNMGFNLIQYQKVPYISNPLNPTGLYIIEKTKPSIVHKDTSFVCPVTNAKMEDYGDHFFCEKSLVSYPKISGIPCLLPEYAILTSKHNETMVG
jgi:uncharacterized protein YbaR (Trm112 family)